MRKAGGIIGLIAGIFGVIGAIVTLAVGAGGAAFRAEGADTVVGLGWAGLLLSFLCIVLGAVAMAAKGRLPGVLLVITAIIAAIVGGAIVAVCMLLALVGGVLAAIPGRERVIVVPATTAAVGSLPPGGAR